MEKGKRDRLARAGWKIGTVQDLLGLTDEEAALVEIRATLATELRARRRARKVSQEVWAKRIGSSQSRVSKIEGGDPSVSIDLLVKTLFKTGASTKELGQILVDA